jgi:GNAT superfamily N-acetyltransferase
MDDGPQRAIGGLSVRPPAGVELRPAGRNDIGGVMALLRARSDARRPEPAAEVVAPRWEAMLGSVDASPFLAVADGTPAGLLLLVFRRRLNFATWEAWVPELVVAEPFRGRGIGRALLRVAIEEWRLRGGHRLSVELEPDEAAGEALLGRMGFEDAFLRYRAEPIASRGRSMPADVVLRGFEADDAEAITRLVAQMGPRHSPVPERMDAVTRTFRELASRPSDRSLLALRDGVAVGVCTAELRATLRRGAPELWIPELIVDEPMRGVGVGGALLDAVIAAGHDTGAGSAILESGPRRASAHRLYDAEGFRPAGRVFTLMRDR